MSNYTKSTNFATKDNLSPGDPLKIVRGTEIDTEFNNISTAISTKTDNSAAAITGGSITGITDLAIADGGTGASTATAALNNLLPSQTGNANKYLQTDGTNATWDAVSLSTADITGTLPVANGGTGVTSSTGTGSVVLSNSPTLVTPALGTPASGVATNLTGLPISTGVSGLGTGVATFLGTPSSANLASAVSDETGTGSLVFANSPTLVTPALGTPSALVGTNITGTASGLTAGNVTTNANLTGAITSTGNATSLGSFSSANLLGALTDETGTGSAVFATSPTLVTPVLGTPTSATLTNATGLPLTTGVTGTLPTANGGTNLTSFTSGGVVYASSTSALATGSGLSFNGTNTFTVVNSGDQKVVVQSTTSGTNSNAGLSLTTATEGNWLIQTGNAVSGGLRFYNAGAGSEAMRLTSTGLGIGTSSPARKLDAQSTTADYQLRLGYNSSFYYDIGRVNSNGYLGFYGSQTGATGFTFGGVDGTRMTLDSAGNLGLGVTPSAWNTIKPIEIARAGSFVGANSSGSTYLGANTRFASGWIYANTGASGLYTVEDNTHFWRIAPSGTAGNTISFTQAMTLDASGNLGVGTTSPQAILDVSRDAEVLIQARCTGATGAGFLRFKNGGGNYYMGPDSSTGNRGFATGGAAYGLVISSESAYPVCFGTNNVERARIDSSGNLLVGTTSIGGYTPRLRVVSGSTQHGAEIQANNSGYYAGLIMNTATSGDNYFLYFGTEANGDSQRGSITYNRAGGLTAYNTTSDYRAKDISGPVTGSGALIDSVPVYMGTMKGATQERPMFIAHEVPAYAHTGEKDAVDADGNPVYQQMDASALIPVMWAEIQSLRQRLSAANL